MVLEGSWVRFVMMTTGFQGGLDFGTGRRVRIPGVEYSKRDSMAALCALLLQVAIWTDLVIYLGSFPVLDAAHATGLRRRHARE
jgi:hypothetical protein